MLRPQPLSRAPELPVTAGLAAIALAVGLAQVLMDADVSRLYLTDAAFWQEPWRLATSILPHGDPIHLAFNLYWLWIFGAIVEDRYGHLKTLGIILAFAVGSGAAQYATGVGGIGLSGVGYGLFGLLFALGRKDRRLMGVMDDSTARLFAVWFVACIALTYANIMAIANVAHGMGAFLGVGLGLAIANPSHGWAKDKRWVPALAALGVVVGVVMPVVVAWQFRAHFLIGSDGAHESAVAAQDAFERGEFEEALAAYERAAEIEPDEARHWFNVGVANGRLARWDAAAKAHERAYDLSPSDNSYRKGYITALSAQAISLKEQDPARAEAIFEELTRIAPKDGMTWLQLAMLREQRGDEAGAAEARQKAELHGL